MKRLGGWDTAVGGAVALLVIVLAFLSPDFTESFEKKLYDWRLRNASHTGASDNIRLVAIDEKSIEALGRWPWPRSVVADLVRRVSAGNPRVMGLSIVFADPEDEKGLSVVKNLAQDYRDLLSTQSSALAPLWTRLAKDSKYKKTLPKDPLGPLAGFADRLVSASRRLDNDTVLTNALKSAPRTVLAFYFHGTGRPVMEDSADVVARLSARALPSGVVEGDLGEAIEGCIPTLPLTVFGNTAMGWGHTSYFQDFDGTLREEIPVIRFKDGYHLSLAFEMARIALGIPLDKVKVSLGKEIRLGDKRIPLLDHSRRLINYEGSFADIKKISAVDVLQGDPDQASRSFKDKIVLIGITDLGLGSSYVTPLEPSTQFNGVILSTVQNIIEDRFLSRPPWAWKMEWGVLILLGFFVAFLLPRMRALAGALLTMGLSVCVFAAGVAMFWGNGWWVKIFYWLAMLVLGYVMVTARRFLFTERRGEWVEAQSAETNRLLGLSFQSQGLLDMAFEKFQKCPINDEMKGVLYNLALDFERKRQYGKAAVIYDHIIQVDPQFKDAADRAKAARQAGENVAVVGALGGKAGGTIVVGQSAAKPTLGRYEIQKELGRGAMGVVYLGKDPKINRSVAIKTLRFEEDMDAETAKMVRERFFREAESAGTLNHPNIIRIFDAGEDGDISYIAMELLDGEDLKKYVEKANLLPVPQVVAYVTQIAEALDYAHVHGVVHRDIKPANVMRLKDGTLRVTDFGIARITASSKTATGTVLGTPSYMSPEQLSGKKVDGRSDLFSLGVMLYEMLTGEKPFEGESIATLLFKIASEPHPDPRLKSPDRITPALKSVIDKALEKNPETRYQKGAEIARDLRAALESPYTVSSVTTAVSASQAKDEPASSPVVSVPATIKSSPQKQEEKTVPTRSLGEFFTEGPSAPVTETPTLSTSPAETGILGGNSPTDPSVETAFPETVRLTAEEDTAPLIKADPAPVIEKLAVPPSSDRSPEATTRLSAPPPIPPRTLDPSRLAGSGSPHSLSEKTTRLEETPPTTSPEKENP